MPENSLPGEPLDLHASTTSSGFQVRAFRIRWYRGALARRLWDSGCTPAITSDEMNLRRHASPSGAEDGKR